MVGLEKIKQIDPELAILSKEDLEEILASLNELAQLAFDVHWYRKTGSKNPVGLLDSKDGENNINVWKPKKRKQE